MSAPTPGERVMSLVAAQCAHRGAGQAGLFKRAATCHLCVEDAIRAAVAAETEEWTNLARELISTYGQGEVPRSCNLGTDLGVLLAVMDARIEAETERCAGRETTLVDVLKGCVAYVRKDAQAGNITAERWLDVIAAAIADAPRPPRRDR